LSANVGVSLRKHYVAEVFRKENLQAEAEERAAARAAARASLGERLPEDEVPEEPDPDLYVRKFMQRSGVDLDTMVSSYSPYPSFWSDHNEKKTPAPEWWLKGCELNAGGSNPLRDPPPTHQIVKMSKRRSRRKAEESRYDLAIKEAEAKKQAAKQAAALEKTLASDLEAEKTAKLQAQAIAEGRQQAQDNFQHAAGMPLQKDAKRSWWKRPSVPGYMGPTKFSLAKMRQLQSREDRSCYDEAEAPTMTPTMTPTNQG
jgi:hypothetical protein